MFRDPLDRSSMRTTPVRRCSLGWPVGVKPRVGLEPGLNMKEGHVEVCTNPPHSHCQGQNGELEVVLEVRRHTPRKMHRSVVASTTANDVREYSGTRG